MTNDNQTNPDEKDNFVSEEDTEISLPPPAPNFETAQAAPVQPVIPVAAVPGEALGAFPQHPQVVYVAQPTVVQPNRSWSWIPAALVLLLVATVAGAFVGAELYKRSIYAESAVPYSSEDVSPYADSTTGENKTAKTGEENSLTGKKEAGLNENIKSADGKSELKQINSISTSFAPIQKAGMVETERGTEGEENNQETAEGGDEEENTADENKAEKNKRLSQPDDEEPPPPPVQRKAKELLPKKVENVKDTENIAPPQRGLQD
ncbi:MAG TPA: hypothetical protein VF571_17465 [Pyrinomonadaceae bacterium]